jgi:hypothetical protein
MKMKPTLSIAGIFVALAILVTFGISRQTQPVQAQDQTPPPVPDHVSFGMVGITAGQTVRLSVVNAWPPGPTLPPGPYRVVMAFRGMNGQLLRNARTGEVIRRQVDLERGDAAFIDVDYGDLPPGPVRAQFRAVVTVQPPPVPDNNTLQDGVCIPTVEVISNANERTQFVLTNPAVIRGFNPQPDPPMPE